MKTSLPYTAKVSKDAKECVQECVSEFISFIVSHHTKLNRDRRLMEEVVDVRGGGEVFDGKTKDDQRRGYIDINAGPGI